MDEEINPYDLLSVPIEATDLEIKSAYRKLSLKVHPDRHPNNPDAPRKFHELNQAYELLLDPVRRIALDAKVRLKEERKKRFAGYDSKRRQLQEELEERERAFKKAKVDEHVNKKKREQKNDEIKAEGRRMREEREKELQAQAKERDDASTRKHTDGSEEKEAGGMPGSLDSTVKLKYSLEQYPSLTTPSALAAYLVEHRFGPLDEPIVISVKTKGTKKKKSPEKQSAKYATALVPFLQVGDAFSAVCAAGNKRKGMEGVEVTWAAGKVPKVVEQMKQTTTTAASGTTYANGNKSFGSFSNTPMPSPASTIPGLDFESVTLMRLRQAERERLERELREQEASEEQGDA